METMKQVIFKCTTCEHFNTLGFKSANFIRRLVKFETLTDAFEHLQEHATFDNSNHQIIAVLQDN